MKSFLKKSCAVVALGAFGCGGGATEDLCKGRKAGDLVITEFLNDPDGADTGSEWIEVFNTLGANVNLKGITLYTKKLDGTGVKTHTIRAGTVKSLDYFTMGDVRSGALPPFIGYSYEDTLGALANGEGIIGLKCKELVIDEVKYTTAPKPGRAKQLNGDFTPDSVGNDDETNFCDAPTQFQVGDAGLSANYGSPGVANPSCVGGSGGGSGGSTCLDNGVARDIVTPLPGELVITEVMANPKAVADTAGEWIEVKANAAVDLNNVTVQVGTAKKALSSTDCVRLVSGEFAVLAKNTDGGVNGGLPNVRGSLGAINLTNSGGMISLTTPDAGGIDTATLPSAIDGTAWQLDPLKTDAIANDDPLNYCPATVAYASGDKGTPGGMNSACPVAVDPNLCLDADTGAMRPIVRPVAGDVVVTEFMADPSAASDTVGEWFELFIKNPGDLNGVLIGGSTGTPSPIASQTCLRPDAGSFLVFANNNDPLQNAGLPPVTGVFKFALGNSSGKISISTDAGVLDEAVWSTAQKPGQSSQLSADRIGAVPDGGNGFCSTPKDAGSAYGPNPDGGVSDFGTPGLPNFICP